MPLGTTVPDLRQVVAQLTIEICLVCRIERDKRVVSCLICRSDRRGVFSSGDAFRVRGSDALDGIDRVVDRQVHDGQVSGCTVAG